MRATRPAAFGAAPQGTQYSILMEYVGLSTTARSVDAAGGAGHPAPPDALTSDHEGCVFGAAAEMASVEPAALAAVTTQRR